MVSFPYHSYIFRDSYGSGVFPKSISDAGGSRLVDSSPGEFDFFRFFGDLFPFGIFREMDFDEVSFFVV